MVLCPVNVNKENALKPLIALLFLIVVRPEPESDKNSKGLLKRVLLIKPEE
jgi:hypothetical protein